MGGGNTIPDHVPYWKIINGKNTPDDLWIAGVYPYDTEGSGPRQNVSWFTVSSGKAEYNGELYNLIDNRDDSISYYYYGDMSQYDAYLFEIGLAGAITYTEYDLNNLPPSQYCHAITSFHFDGDNTGAYKWLDITIDGTIDENYYVLGNSYGTYDRLENNESVIAIRIKKKQT